MTMSIATIAQKSLRRLGVRVVPLDDSPTLTEMVPFDTIATKALVELGVNASDETPSAADQALMLDKVASVHAALDAQGIVWWSVGSVPRAFCEESHQVDGLGGGYQLRQAGRAPGVWSCWNRASTRVPMVLSADDNAQQAVQAIHDDLVMRGIARWSSLDIPDVVGEQYAIIAADRLAPLFDEWPRIRTAHRRRWRRSSATWRCPRAARPWRRSTSRGALRWRIGSSTATTRPGPRDRPIRRNGSGRRGRPGRPERWVRLGRLVHRERLGRSGPLGRLSPRGAHRALWGQGGVLEAPSDGVTYGRLNGTTWTGVLALSGGIMNGSLTWLPDPTSALMAATRRYVDNAAPSGGPYLALAGGTMLGSLLLAGDPGSALGAATKQYVDNSAPAGGPYLTALRWYHQRGW